MLYYSYSTFQTEYWWLTGEIVPVVKYSTCNGRAPWAPVFFKDTLGVREIAQQWVNAVGDMSSAVSGDPLGAAPEKFKAFALEAPPKGSPL